MSEHLKEGIILQMNCFCSFCGKKCWKRKLIVQVKTKGKTFIGIKLNGVGKLWEIIIIFNCKMSGMNMFEIILEEP